MPWWKGKAHKSNRSEDSPQSVSLTGSAPFDSPRSSSSSRHSLQLAKNRPSELKSRGVGIEDSTAGVGARVGLRSPVTGNSLRFSGFDSDTGGGGVGGEGERECHPLPRPSGSNIPVHGSDHGDGAIGSGGGSGGLVGLVNGGSASVSSVSSSGSSDDPPPPLTDQFAQPGVSRRHDEVRHHIRARSAGPRSRGATPTVSPHHPRLGGGSLESLTGKAEDGRSQGHPLPLPPSSPTSSSAVHNGKASFPSEKLRYNTPSKWMKGTLLGRGTFGHVYLGFNSEKGRMCAIKEVRVVFDDQNSKECLKQLNQEINLLSQLSHPNIVQYYGSELGEERLSVYLEYVSGGSIHKLLQQYGPFKEPVIQSYTSQILSGLAYLHARNTVHRDIKGANILVDPHGEIKLADFGMAKHIANSASVLSFKGSPYWMAPEVVMNTNGYDLAVDIWSLGCTIFEMATSKPPWSQFEGVAAIFKIGNSKDIPEIPVHLSNEAKDFLRLCFQRDPSARPSAADLLNHPFVMDQTATTVSSLSLTTEAFHFTYDGSCKPKTLDIHPRRKSTSSYGAENVESSVVPVSRELWDNARTIISLPVSPSSSPLRQSNPGYRSCLPSPPHPAYPSVGQTNHPRNDFLLSPTHGQPLSYSSDNWNDRQPWSRAQTPSALLGMRLI